MLLTPSSLPPSIHFWSTLSPIAPRSPAKLSFQVGSLLPISERMRDHSMAPSMTSPHFYPQFPSSGSAQVHIPSISVDGLSTPVVLSPGPQKP